MLWRPKLLWRVTFPLLLGVAACLFALDEVAAGAFIGCVGAFGSAAAWTRRLRLDGDTLGRAGLGAPQEVDMTALVLVSLGRDLHTDHWPAKKLRVFDSHANRLEIQPWFWPRAAVNAINAAYRDG